MKIFAIDQGPIKTQLEELATSFRQQFVGEDAEEDSLKHECLQASRDLCDLIRQKLGRRATVVMGTFQVDDPNFGEYSEWDVSDFKNEKAMEKAMYFPLHYWVEVDKLIVDITASQFDNQLDGEEMPKVIVEPYANSPRHKKGKILMASTTKELVVIRGIPGSGKSTLAKELGKGGKVFSSDDFFMVNGRYQFDVAFQGEAHLWNQGRVRRAMREGVSPIVVDNTNVTLGEISPYKKLASENGYTVRYAEPDTPWKFDVDELTKRNTHKVPKDVIQRMLDKWQPTETLGNPPN